MEFVAVPPSSELRGAVEDVIRRRYWSDYQAVLRAFPEVLVAEVSSSGGIDCAAGVRFGHQPFFSEHYLDLPVELTLRREIGQGIDRKRVVEVCHLAAARAGHALPFVQRLIEFVCMANAEWAIFTATAPLRDLLRRGGVEMIELARAEIGRVLNPGDWGSYFEHDPRVMAVSRLVVTGSKHLCRARASATPVVHA